MITHNTSTNILVPGGPCISGEYWDYFKNNASLDFKRIVLLNHEAEHNPAKNISYNDLVLDFKNKVSVIARDKKVNLIAHSFGAWVVLSSLEDEDFRAKISKTILISLPFKVTKSPDIEKSIKNLIKFKILNDESFLMFWKTILPLYFNNPPPAVFEKLLTKEAFWEGNNNVTLEQETLDHLTEKLKTSPETTLIYGELDRITPPSKDFSYKTISGSAHFPMLENIEKFTQMLRAYLQ